MNAMSARGQGIASKIVIATRTQLASLVPSLLNVNFRHLLLHVYDLRHVCLHSCPVEVFPE